MTSDAKKEFLQKYRLDNYSKAVPAKAVPGKGVSLGEYCEPVDSRKTRRTITEDSDDYNSDSDQRYALPQDAIKVKKETRKSRVNIEEDSGDVYDLAKQPMEEYNSPPQKPSPKPRGSKHVLVQKSDSVSTQHTISTFEPQKSGTKPGVQSAEGGPVVAPQRRREPKKVVEIEYEEARPRNSQSFTTSDKSQFSIKPSDRVPHTAPVASQAFKSFVSSPDLTPTPAKVNSGQPLPPPLGAEGLYEEPWDLKVKRLKQEQEKMGQKVGSRPDSSSSLVKKPSIYEDALDSTDQRQKVAERKNYVKSLSQTSETEIFHDAVETLPDEKMDKTSSQTQEKDAQPKGSLKPLPTNTYEDAWDLKNSILEQKIREMQLQASATYEEPWDLKKKQQQAMQAKLLAQSSVPVGPSEKGQSPCHRSHSDAYDAAWESGNPRFSSLRDHKHHSVDDSRIRSKIRGCNVGQQINPLIPLSSQNWYHGNITRDDAEKMLCVCKEGSYIVRISSDRKSYSLSIKSAKQFIHVQIEERSLPDGDIRYILGKNSKEFSTIPEMIDYYTHHRVPLKGAEHITLLHPVECKWS